MHHNSVMEKLTRRRMFALALIAVPALAAEPSSESVEGVLSVDPSGHPALRTKDGRLIALAGDPSTVGALKDTRLAGTDFEALGHFTAPGEFTVDPIYKRAMFVHKDGKRLMVTYWCDVCGIRSYTPGPCWCCQQETELDLREKL
jgi:hypothetical protein